MNAIEFEWKKSMEHCKKQKKFFEQWGKFRFICITAACALKGRFNSDRGGTMRLEYHQSIGGER